MQRLIADEDVTQQSGIYEYLLTGDERRLNIRVFSEETKQRAYEEQDGRCAACEEAFSFADTDADHIEPWSKGGRTVEDNCRVLCRKCNKRKGAT